MSIHIGLMIWKEMKRQSLTAADLAGSLEISKGKAQTILNTSSIDTGILLRICEILNFNFFQLYENDSASIKQLRKQSDAESRREIERLKSLLVEKNKIIDLKDQLLKTQNNEISLLEKGSYSS